MNSIIKSVIGLVSRWKIFKLKILLILLFLIYAFISVRNGGDFDVFLYAARLLRLHADIYVFPGYKGLQYYYSVLFALLLSPFSHYVFFAEFIWELLGLYWLISITQMVYRYLKIEFLSRRHRIWFSCLLLLLSLQYIMENVVMIQMTIFLLWAIFKSFELFHTNQKIKGAALLALAINIKIIPVLFLPYLLLRGRYKEIFLTLSFILVYLFLPAIFIGIQYNNHLLHNWWEVVNPLNHCHTVENRIGGQSVSSWLPTMLMPISGELIYKRNFVNLPASIVSIILRLFQIGLLCLSLVFMKGSLFREEKDDFKRFYQMAYFFLLIPLVMPHQQRYEFLFILPILSWILYYFIRTAEVPKTLLDKVCLIVFIICCFFFSPLFGSDVIGFAFFRICLYFKFITIATLLLIPISIYLSPDKLKFILSEHKIDDNQIHKSC